jgi:hypothetical protein
LSKPHVVVAASELLRHGWEKAKGEGGDIRGSCHEDRSIREDF